MSTPPPTTFPTSTHQILIPRQLLKMMTLRTRTPTLKRMLTPIRTRIPKHRATRLMTQIFRLKISVMMATRLPACPTLLSRSNQPSAILKPERFCLAQAKVHRSRLHTHLILYFLSRMHQLTYSPKCSALAGVSRGATSAIPATTPIHGGTISAKYAAPIGPLLTAPNPKSTRGRTFGSAHHRNAIHCAGQLPVTAPCTRLSRCLMVSSHTLALTA